MRSNLVVVLSLLVAAPCAYAQNPAPTPDSCETVTTVRCTGSVAPLAVPPNQPVGQPVHIAPPVQQAAPDVLPPVPPPPDACDECAATPRPRVNVAPPGLSGPWQLRMEEGGSASYLRVRSTGKASVWAPGLVVWLGSYVATAAAGIARDNNPYAAIPIFGAIGSGIAYGVGGDSTGAAIGYSLSGVAQVAGMATFIVGTVAGPKKLERMPVQIGPVANRDGGGLSIAMKF